MDIIFYSRHPFQWNLRTFRWFFSFFVAFCPPAKARCVAPPPKPRWPPSMEMKYSQPPGEFGEHDIQAGFCGILVGF